MRLPLVARYVCVISATMRLSFRIPGQVGPGPRRRQITHLRCKRRGLVSAGPPGRPESNQSGRRWHKSKGGRSRSAGSLVGWPRSCWGTVAIAPLNSCWHFYKLANIVNTGARFFRVVLFTVSGRGSASTGTRRTPPKRDRTWHLSDKSSAPRNYTFKTKRLGWDVRTLPPHGLHLCFG